MPDGNVIMKSPIAPAFAYDAVVEVTSSLNVLTFIKGSLSTGWDLRSDWARSLVRDTLVTPVYQSQDEMRFGPRYYDDLQTEMISQAVHERQPLPELPLAIG